MPKNTNNTKKQNKKKNKKKNKKHFDLTTDS